MENQSASSGLQPPAPSSNTPEIPRLDVLARGRRIGARRGRGRGRGAVGPEARPDPDAIVQATDQDANASRQSAVRIGFLKDPFASTMAVVESLPRLPIINRGKPHLSTWQPSLSQD